MLEDVNLLNTRDIVVKYIAEHDGPIQAQIIDFMRGYDSSREPVEEKSPKPIAAETTLDILEELTKITDNKIAVVIRIQDKNNRKKYHYYLNTEFKVVYDQLKNIDRLILAMNLPMHKLNKTKSMGNKKAEQKQLSINLHAEYAICIHEYISPYVYMVNTILYHLFEKLSVMKISKEDSEVFYHRIIELIRKLYEQTLETKDLKDDLKLPKEQFLKLKEKIDSHDYVAEKYFDHKIIDKLMKTLNDFDK